MFNLTDQSANSFYKAGLFCRWTICLYDDDDDDDDDDYNIAKKQYKTKNNLNIRSIAID